MIYFIGIIISGVFSSSVSAENVRPITLAQLSIQIEDLNRQLQSIQHQIKTQFTAIPFISSNENADLVSENPRSRHGPNKIRTNLKN